MVHLYNHRKRLLVQRA